MRGMDVQKNVRSRHGNSKKKTGASKERKCPNCRTVLKETEAVVKNSRPDMPLIAICEKCVQPFHCKITGDSFKAGKITDKWMSKHDAATKKEIQKMISVVKKMNYQKNLYEKWKKVFA